MKKKNPSSNIPKARALLQLALETRKWRYVKQALPLLFRAKMVRRAKAQKHKTTAAQKRSAMRLVVQEPDTSYHKIANRTGLGNGGRVSELATGKRK